MTLITQPPSANNVIGFDMTWNDIDSAPEDKVVETKVDDANGVRNVTRLIRSGNLWFYPNMSMYVYYRPTHWRNVTSE